MIEGGIDFSFLLERGYNRRAALDIVTARWRLSRLERLALYRGVFDTTTSRTREAKTVRNPTRLAVDGFNVLSTIQSALLGDSLILATDGFVRDLAATLRKIRVTPTLVSALTLALNYVIKLGISELIIVFDAQISKSGELAKFSQGALGRMGLKGTSLTSSRADTLLVSFSEEYTVATSDSLLLDRVGSALDLGGLVSSLVAEENVINLKDPIKSKVSKLAEAFAQGARAYDEEARNES